MDAFITWLLEHLQKFGDTKTAMVIVAVVVGFVVWKARGWKEKLATKKELADHEMKLLNQSVILEGNITGTLHKFNARLDDHEQQDDQRFEKRDHALIPQLKIMDDKIVRSQLSLARIEGKLGIPPQPEPANMDQHEEAS